MAGIKTVWWAVRHESGREFALLDEMAATLNDAVDAADSANRRLPAWSKVNPIKRFAQFEIREVAS